MRKRYLTVLTTIFTFLMCTGLAAGQNKNSRAEAIIAKMAARYAAVSSYQDSGVVETVRGGSLPTRSTDIFYRTYFTRPLKLRFEWTSYAPFHPTERSMVWSDGTKTFEFYSIAPDKIGPVEDVGMAIAGATGVSLGSAHHVPTILMEKGSGSSLMELTKLSLKGHERFEGEDCYIVEGYRPNGEVWQLWIGEKDFFLRKLRHKSIDEEFEEEIHRDIQVDMEIQDGVYHPKITAGHVNDGITKEKEADIWHLIELLRPRERTNQQLNDVLGLMKKAMPQVPEKIWQEVIAELHLDAEMLLRMYEPIYDKHYSREEIKQLIILYESPLGQKIRRNSDLIETEAARSGEEVGRELMKRIQEKLQSKGYKAAIT